MRTPESMQDTYNPGEEPVKPGLLPDMLRIEAQEPISFEGGIDALGRVRKTLIDRFDSSRRERVAVGTIAPSSESDDHEWSEDIIAECFSGFETVIDELEKHGKLSGDFREDTESSLRLLAWVEAENKRAFLDAHNRMNEELDSVTEDGEVDEYVLQNREARKTARRLGDARDGLRFLVDLTDYDSRG